MTLASCLYEGDVLHQRFSPVEHQFRRRMFMMYVDLAELPTLFRGCALWSTTRINVAWFRRADHLGDRNQTLEKSVRQLIAEKTGKTITGPIRLLTHFRYFGFAMNPISLYYCFDHLERLQFVVAEVTNTPWGERCSYVLDLTNESGGRLNATHLKSMHVSPFLCMHYCYHFQFTAPGETLEVFIQNLDSQENSQPPIFTAGMKLKRRPLSRHELFRALLRFPFMTGQVYAGIYWEALRLWWKRAPYFAYPMNAHSIDDPLQRVSARGHNGNDQP